MKHKVNNAIINSGSGKNTLWIHDFQEGSEVVLTDPFELERMLVVRAVQGAMACQKPEGKRSSKYISLLKINTRYPK